MALQGSNDNEKLQSLILKPYKEQAIWLMNAFWDTFAEKEAEKLWAYVDKCVSFDLEKRGEGNGLDEVRAHKFLESFNETLTVMAMREKLRQTGAISQSDRPKIVPLIHYLLFRYNCDWHQLVNTAGDNSDEIKQAQSLLLQVIEMMAESERQAQLVRQAEANVRKSEEAAKKAEQAARDEEAPFKAAQEEVDTALADVKSQEDARNQKTESLKKQSEEGGVVQQNKAKNLLAQHLAEDPLPLRKAKVTLEAALKKAEKARAPFEAATKRAVDARKVAEDATSAAQEATKMAEKAVEAAADKVKEAEDFLEMVKRKPGTPHGAIWWSNEN